MHGMGQTCVDDTVSVFQNNGIAGELANPKVLNNHRKYCIDLSNRSRYNQPEIVHTGRWPGLFKTHYSPPIIDHLYQNYNLDSLNLLIDYRHVRRL